ncbi:MAG: hypothetical protein ACPGSD_08065 [Flavobacteriales bacterium]
MSKYTILLFSILFQYITFGQSESNTRNATYLRLELPITMRSIPNMEESIIQPYSFSGNDIKIEPQFSIQLDKEIDNFGFTVGVNFNGQKNTRTFLKNHFNSGSFSILDKSLEESVWRLNLTIAPYLYKEIDEKNALNYEFIWQYNYSTLRDNIIIHTEKNPGVHVPLVEYKKMSLEEYSLGLGVKYFRKISNTNSIYGGVQCLIPFKANGDVEVNYFDDYYIYKDIKNVDLPEVNTNLTKRYFRFNIILGIRVLLFG